MSLTNKLKDLGKKVYNKDKLATIAYGANITPYIPAIILNTGRRFTENQAFLDLVKTTSDYGKSISNPESAIFFLGLRIADKYAPVIGNNKYVNVFRSLVGGLYGIATLGSLLAAGSDSDLINLVKATTSGLMAVELISEVNESNSRRRNSLKEDFIEIHKDLKNRKDNVLDFINYLTNREKPVNLEEVFRNVGDSNC